MKTFVYTFPLDRLTKLLDGISRSCVVWWQNKCKRKVTVVDILYGCFSSFRCRRFPQSGALIASTGPVLYGLWCNLSQVVADIWPRKGSDVVATSPAALLDTFKHRPTRVSTDRLESIFHPAISLFVAHLSTGSTAIINHWRRLNVQPRYIRTSLYIVVQR